MELNEFLIIAKTICYLTRMSIVEQLMSLEEMQGIYL